MSTTSSTTAAKVADKLNKPLDEIIAEGKTFHPGTTPRPRQQTQPRRQQSAPANPRPAITLGHALYVANLPPYTLQIDVERLFGDVNPDTFRGVTFFRKYDQSCAAIVSYSSKRDAEKAIELMNGRVVENKTLVVEWKQTKRGH